MGSTSWYTIINEGMVKGVERITNEHMTTMCYAGGLMGDEADTIRKVRMKQLVGVGVTNMGTMLIIPELCVLALPFLFDWEPELYYNGKYCEVDYILKKLEPTTRKLVEKRGFEYWGFAETCFDRIGSQVPIRSVEDFQKLKFWLFRGDRIRPEINKVFGFKKTASGGLFDAASMLSVGMIDSCFGGWYMHVILQWWPHLKYITDYPVYGYESASCFINSEFFKRLAAFGDKWGPRYASRMAQIS